MLFALDHVFFPIVLLLLFVKAFGQFGNFTAEGVLLQEFFKGEN